MPEKTIVAGVATPEAAAPARPVARPAPAPPEAPARGRQALRDLRRQLTDEELKNPGVHKLLLDELERSDVDCAELRTYVDRYHEADKRAAILEEKRRTDHTVEVFFGLGTSLGGAIIGLVPYFYELFKPALTPGNIALSIGGLLIIGAIGGRMVKR